MGFFDFLNNRSSTSSNEIENIFPLALIKNDFIHNDIVSTYQKILTDTIDRTFGIPKAAQQFLWDNALVSENNCGLVSMLAQAMADQKDLFIVYKPSIGVIRKATFAEEQVIRADYQKDGSSKNGVYVSFKKYKRTMMFKIWSEFEYCLLAGMNKQLHISQAMQIKINELRSSVSLNDSTVAVAQAQSIASALKKGNDVMIDKNDEVAVLSVNMDASEKGMDFLAQKKAWILSVTAAYLSGEQTSGIGSTGENDSRALENGLKQYFLTIIKPVCDLLFDIDCKFRSRDFRDIASSLEVLKTFDLVSNENISQQAKQEIVARVFDLDLDEEQKQIKKEGKSQVNNNQNQVT